LGKGADSVGDCLIDAKAAIRWLRAHATELHVDPTKVVAGGGSGGATLAADAVMVEGFDAPDDDHTISAKPDVLVLLTPALFEPAFVPGRFDEELQVYPGEHGFFNYGRDDNRPYQATLRVVEQFLASLDLLASDGPGRRPGAIQSRANMKSRT
jgi:dienelactone hydrolase